MCTCVLLALPSALGVRFKALVLWLPLGVFDFGKEELFWVWLVMEKNRCTDFSLLYTVSMKWQLHVLYTP